ncbi:bile acid:sodium symporter [Bradyrhizobium sp. 179]|uniref:bile acid:sodium symporter n=1 Tax=Bradyrhizobium sp. 179 TaxID=2782648 RepID=UPI001FF88701|nr:bile acid:sodium symporter [Bradyrhizobium sp. 179]MCK1540532.1 bile acid:sodium symporter [Bradyrhizobium sp. 179]
MTTLVATLPGPRPDSFTAGILAALCGSKKSLSPGVPIAGALFPSAEVGGMILLVIFHQIQLAVRAVLARRRAARATTIEGEVAP